MRPADGGWSSGHLPESVWIRVLGLERTVWGVPRVVWLLVLGALVLRLFALWLIDGPDLVSASESGITAHNWVSGRGYTFDLYGYRVGQPLQAFMPPLFTAIVALSLLTPWPAAVFGLIQIILSSLTVLLVYLIAQRVSGRIVALLAALLTAVYPPFLVLADQPTVPVLNTFLLGLWLIFSLRLLESWEVMWAVLAGLVLGLSVLSRPAFIGLLLVMLIALWFHRFEKRTSWWRHAMVVMGIMGLTVVPWLVRNGLVLGSGTTISTNGGFNAWTGNNPFTTGSCFDVVIPNLEAYSGETVPGNADRLIVEVKPYPLPLELRGAIAELGELELDRAFYGVAFSFVREEPGRWLALIGRKLVGLWWFRQNVGRSSGFYDQAWILPYKILYAATLGLAVIGFVLSTRHWRRYLLLYGMFAYLTVAYLAYHVITRYRWEMEPYLLIFTSLAIVHILHQGEKWLQRRRIVSASV
jgi:4-amino-4-deoxy-L-arabinose transferase-like glycosyltransferase